jgi:hypothetical protein
MTLSGSLQIGIILLYSFNRLSQMRGAIKAQSCCVLGAVPVGPHPAAEAFELCCGTMSQMSQSTSREMCGRLNYH